LLLTRDRDLMEQFYKLCWLVDTHYRAMLIAKAYVRQPELYEQLPLPTGQPWEGLFDMSGGFLWATPGSRMNDFLPGDPHFVAVECWVLGKTTSERLVFGAETEMADVLAVKGHTRGLVSGDLNELNVHPWLVPMPLPTRLRNCTGFLTDRFIEMSDGVSRLGAFDVTRSINTQERFTRLRQPWPFPGVERRL